MTESIVNDVFLRSSVERKNRVGLRCSFWRLVPTRESWKSAPYLRHHESGDMWQRT